LPNGRRCATPGSISRLASEPRCAVEVRFDALPIQRGRSGSSLRFLGFSLVGSTLKFHVCALARLGDAMRKASLWFAFGGLLELCLTVVGARLDELQGLVVGWTLAVSIEGAFAALVFAFATKLDFAASAARKGPAPSPVQT
jgi:hypothetical protein